MCLLLVQAQAAQVPELEEQVEGLQRSAARAGRMRQAVAQMQEEVAQLPVLKQVLKDLQVNTQQMARVKQDIERLKVGARRRCSHMQCMHWQRHTIDHHSMVDCVHANTGHEPGCSLRFTGVSVLYCTVQGPLIDRKRSLAWLLASLQAKCLACGQHVFPGVMRCAYTVCSDVDVAPACGGHCSLPLPAGAEC
jgi:hypothetical protein